MAIFCRNSALKSNYLHIFANKEKKLHKIRIVDETLTNKSYFMEKYHKMTLKAGTVVLVKVAGNVKILFSKFIT